MRVKRVRLSNGYKRFHDLTIDLGDSPARVIALVGPNGCGKSSVLDGMLFKMNSFAAIGRTGLRDYSYHSMHGLINYPHNNVDIQFVGTNFEALYGVKQQAGKERTIFSFRSPYRYNSNLKVAQSQAVPDIKLNDYGASQVWDLDQKMESNYRRLNVAYNRYLHAVDCAPSQAKAHIVGQLNASIKNCLGLELSGLGDIEASKGTLFFKKPDHPTEFEFNVLSSGEKEVVDILLDLYLRKDEFNDTVFLLDEPELHINTAIQRKLLIEINRLIGSDCQLWICTHSIGFLRALQDEFRGECQIIQFSEDMPLASQAVTLRPEVMTTSKWRSLFHVALDDLVSLVSPRRIIYCEGRDAPGSGGAERGLDAIVFNRIFSENYPDTLFVSSGGNTELDQRSTIAIAIISKALPGVEIFVLKDRDISSGRLTTEADRRLYLDNNPDTHRVLKRWEIENYLYDKSVLERYCASNSLIFDAAEYDGFVTDINNQNLKDETARIRNFCGITTSINADKFKQNLAAYITPDMPVFVELAQCVFQRA